MSEPQRISHSIGRPGNCGKRIPLAVDSGMADDYGDFSIFSPDGRDVARLSGHLIEPLAAFLNDLIEVRRRDALESSYRSDESAPVAAVGVNARGRLHLRFAMTARFGDTGKVEDWAVEGRSRAPVSVCAQGTRAEFPADAMTRTAHVAVSIPWPPRNAALGRVEGILEP